MTENPTEQDVTDDAGVYRAECHDCDESETYESEHAAAKAYNWVESHELTGHSAFYYEVDDAE